VREPRLRVGCRGRRWLDVEIDVLLETWKGTLADE
jgi:hypothetical protein